MKRNTERWKRIRGFDNYQVSSFGRIKSSKILKPNILKTGYHLISLNRGKKQYKKLISVLVLTHFGPPKPSPEYECNHEDGDKSNNWWTNLEWMTRRENINHAYEIGLRERCHGEKSHLSKVTKDQVFEMHLLRKEFGIDIKRLALIFNIHHTTISKIISNKIWRR